MPAEPGDLLDDLDEMAAEDIPAEDIPAEGTPAEGTPAKETPADARKIPGGAGRMPKSQSISWVIAGALFSVVLVWWIVLGKRGVERIEGGFERWQNQREARVENPLVRANSQNQVVAQQFYFNDAALAVLPAVVGISTYRNLPGGGSQTGHSWLGVGSGFIVSPQGHILTTARIASKATHIKVTRFDQGHTHIYEGELVASFPAKGLAVIKISAADPLPTTMLGDSSVSDMGDWVLAIGSRMGMKQTTVKGIISSVDARGRLKTSMPVRASLAGGALVNNAGEVIGIMSGRGYAVPSNKARSVLANLQVPYSPNLRMMAGGGLR